MLHTPILVAPTVPTHCPTTGSCSVIAYLYPAPESSVTTLALVSFLIYGSLELIRISFPGTPVSDMQTRFLKPILRPHETTQPSSAVYYVFGVFVVSWLFSGDIALMGVLFVGFCDTAASLVGRAYGKYTLRYPNGKSLAGSLGAVVTGIFLTVFVYSVLPGFATHRENFYVPAKNRIPLPVLAVLGGVIAAGSEVVDI